MTLAFQTHWPKTMSPHLAGKPTYFPEKIIRKMTFRDEVEDYACSEYSNIDWELIGSLHTKIHTIREDAGNRWKAGNDIHMVINNRTKNRLQFAPVTKCVSVQEIEIKHHSEHSDVLIDGKYFGGILHHGLNEIYDFQVQLKPLIVNDGFDALDDFFSWFNKDFKGKIIHWTDFKY